MAASEYTWTSDVRVFHPEGWLARLDSGDLQTFLNFTSSLEWRLDPSACTAFVEFAYLFWVRGYVLRSCSAADSNFRDLTFWLRRVLVFFNKLSSHGVFPGKTDQYKLKTEGRALPQGAIVGASIRFSVDELANFAELLSSTGVPSTCRLGSSLCRLFCFLSSFLT